MSSSEVPARRPDSHDRRLLLFAVLSVFLANVVQWGLVRVVHHGNSGTLKDEARAFLHVRQWTDSWLPMMKSIDYFQSAPDVRIYHAPIYDTLIYPLASLLPMYALRRLGISDPAMLRLLAWTTWLCIPGIAVAALLMGRRLLHARGARLGWMAIAGIFLLALCDYPVLKGYMLGNAQTYLSLGFTVLLLLWTAGRERASGVLTAILAFVKPQFGLLLIWFALRRKWNAAVACVVSAVVLLAVSIAVFGWRNNLDYVSVLSGLSRKAQSHFANQSMFGTLNRMIFNGENIGYTPYVYTPYIPWVYRVTLLTALVLVVAVLAFPWGRMRGTTADLAAAGIISVAISPMAWEHHYGILLGVFAWVWFAYGCWQRRVPWLLALSALFGLNFWSSANLLWDKVGWNVLQSYMYFAALLLVAVLMAMSRRLQRGEAEPVL